MSLGGIGAREDTKCQNVLANLSNLMSKFIFSELKACFAKPFPKPFPKGLISVLSVYLHHLGRCIRQIRLKI